MDKAIEKSTIASFPLNFRCYSYKLKCTRGPEDEALVWEKSLE